MLPVQVAQVCRKSLIEGVGIRNDAARTGAKLRPSSGKSNVRNISLQKVTAIGKLLRETRQLGKQSNAGEIVGLRHAAHGKARLIGQAGRINLCQANLSDLVRRSKDIPVIRIR